MATTVTQTQSWISRLGGSFKNVLFGIVLFIVAFPVLFNNEGRAIRRAKVLDEGRGAVVSLPSSDNVDPANEGKLVHVTGKTRTSDTLQDSDFGVAVQNKIRLVRKVSMFQWHESTSTSSKEKLGGAQETTTTYTYSKGWADYPVSSDEFMEKEHDNPPFPSLMTSEQQAAIVTFGAFSLPPEIVSRIRDEKPIAVAPDDVNDNFAKFAAGGVVYIPANPEKSAQVLSNSDKAITANATNTISASSGVTNAVEETGAATNNVVQVAKDILVNPMSTISPDIGDIKVEFFATDESDLSVISVQKGETFVPYASKKGQLQLVSMGIHSADEMFLAAEKSNKFLTWLLRVAGFMLMYIGLKTILGPIAMLGAVVPFVKKILDFGVGVVAFGIALICALSVCAIAWLFYRPLYSAVLGVAIVVVIFWMLRKKHSKKSAEQPAQ